MNRIIASSLAVALSCAPAFAFAQDRPADQQKNQSQSDASSAATGGERAEQARGEAGSNTPAAAGESSDASSSNASGAQSPGSSGAAAAGRANGAATGTDAVRAGASDAPDGSATDLAQPAAARDSADAAAMQDPTKMFIMDTYNSNLFEIQSSQLASQKVQDDKVKQHARMMIEDHTQANQKLKQVAQSAQVQLPAQLDAVHQAKLQKMQQIPASELGRKYMNSQVASHWMSVLEFRYQAKNAQNPQVKQFASQMLPKLEQHLQHAQKMAEQHAGSSDARTASERQPADASATPSDAGTGTRTNGQSE